MPKMTFICQHIDPFTKDELAEVTYKSNNESLDEVIEDFQDFLKGCGYNFNGTLTIIENEGMIINSIDDVQHNDYYYDTNRNR